MKSSSVNSSFSSYPCNVPKGNNISSHSKPPVPPKPTNLGQYRPCNASNVLINSSNSTGHSKIYTISPYSSYPSAVLIQNADNAYPVFVDSASKTGFESVVPLSPPIFPSSGVKSVTRSPQTTFENALPPLSKAEITPNYGLPQRSFSTNEQVFNNKSEDKFSKANAKNALLMEKMGSAVTVFSSSCNEAAPQSDSGQAYAISPITINNCNIVPIHVNEQLQACEFPKQSLSQSVNQRKSRNLHYTDALSTNTMQNSTNLQQHMANGSDAPLNEERCPLCFNCQRICQCEKFPSKGDGRRSSDINFYDMNCTGGENKYQNKSASPDMSFTSNGVANCDVTDSSCVTNNILSTSTLDQTNPTSGISKPPLKKTEAFDKDNYDYYKRLSRGISRATDNVNIVLKAQSEIANGIWETLENGSVSSDCPFFVETPVLTFTLPDLSVYSDSFRKFLEKDLIEMSTLLSLESAGRLNWWHSIGCTERLWPLATTGDGNCLLHAASLGMWGFHDRLLTLRKALHEFLTRSRFSRPLWRRWRWQAAMQNKETDLVLSSEEWDAEWGCVLQLASSAPRGGPQSGMTSSAPNLSETSANISQGKINSDVSGPVYESLEEIHVLALAHVLRRPIIVVADTTLKDMNGDPLAPISFGGIYLPLECPPNECQRSPLILTYDAAHFSALVIMETNEEHIAKPHLPAVIPITDCTHKILPIQFLVDPGELVHWDKDEADESFVRRFEMTDLERRDLLSAYLDLTQVSIPSSYLETCGVNSYEDVVAPMLPESASDLDKRPSDVSFDSDDSHAFSDGGAPISSKARNPMQIQTMVKSFGSIGRSMSKRIKKNFNNLSKFSRSNSFRKKTQHPIKGELGFNANKFGSEIQVGIQQNFILGAKILTDKRHPFQQEMIDNYLTNARERFLKASENQNLNKNYVRSVKAKSSHAEISYLQDKPTDSPDGYLTECINPGCELYGSDKTSYMCQTCFNRQKEEEEKALQKKSEDNKTHSETRVDHDSHQVVPNSSDFGIQYGTGKSRFYTQLDENSVKKATMIPVVPNIGSSKDKTLFLSNSTFYNDTNPSNIPSYNLSKDLRESRLKTSSGSSSDSIKHRSSSSNSEKIKSNRLSQDRLMTTKDTLPPVSIDTLKRTGTSKLNQSATVPRPNSCTPVGITSVASNSCLPCRAPGCEFFGSFSTDFLCSKCHSSSKNVAAKSVVKTPHLCASKDVDI